MGEKAPDVSTEPSPQVLEHEVEVIRDNVTQIAQELDQRRRDLFDWRYQLKQHATMTLLVGAAALFTFGAAVAFGKWQRRRKTRPMKKARQLRDALARAWDHPERVALPRQNIGAKVLTAAVVGATGVAAKSLTRRIISSTDTAG